MISVGIDVSKEKSTVCIMKPGGELIQNPREYEHTETDLCVLTRIIKGFGEETRVVMEATGVYHLPVAEYLIEHDIFVSVINPYVMKQYARQGIRKVKTDRKDSITIAQYGIEKWYKLEQYSMTDDVYRQLKLLSRQYRFHMSEHVQYLQNLNHLMDYTMPGLRKLFSSLNQESGKDKLSDFALRFWHCENITKMSESKYIEVYNRWAERKGYRKSDKKAAVIYQTAKNSIPTMPASPTTKMLIIQAVECLKRVDEALTMILARMRELAKSLDEYEVVREMEGVGEILAVRLIADIGDVRMFRNGKALVAYAGVDPPPHESGQFIAPNRRISKRGSSALRKTGYEVIRSIMSHKPEYSSVYKFILKKRAEGKPTKVSNIAGMNKFLRIYYARVMEIYS